MTPRSDGRPVTNRSGIELERVYSPAHGDGRDLPDPGVPPFTRGIYPGMYRDRTWTKRQLVGTDSPESFNRRQRSVIDNGGTAVSLVICNSTYRGLDVDDVPQELIGTCGTPINCLEDLRIAFDGLPLGELSFGLNDPSPFTMAAMLLVIAEEQGVPWSSIHGTSNQSDCISHYVANHMFLRLPLEGSLRVLTDHVRFVREHVPGWNPVSVVGQHMQEGGATPLQSVAFTLATAIEYVQAAVDAGLDIDDVGPRITFFHDISLSLFEEVAKLRAQRRMWAKLMKERFGAQDERTMRFKVHTQTSGAELTREAPHNNIIRVTVQALAAVLGGTQSLHTDGFDEALATPNEDAARLALSTQHILEEETGIPDVVDPLGGSYYVEALTDEIEARSWRILNDIEQKGGMLEACRAGWIQQEIGQSAWRYQRDIEEGRRHIVGVTKHRTAEKGERSTVPIDRPDPAAVAAQIERVQHSRTNRDGTKAEQSRDRIRDLAANPGDNAFAATVDGVRAGLTHGEIVAAMRDAFGFGRPVVSI